MKDRQPYITADPIVVSSFPLQRSRTNRNFLRNGTHVDVKRPMTSFRRQKQEQGDPSVIKLRRSQQQRTTAEKIRLPIASYYYTSSFPSLYATFCTDGLRKNSGLNHSTNSPSDTTLYKSSTPKPAVPRLSVHIADDKSSTNQSPPNTNKTEANQDARFPWRHLGRTSVSYDAIPISDNLKLTSTVATETNESNPPQPPNHHPNDLPADNQSHGSDDEQKTSNEKVDESENGNTTPRKPEKLLHSASTTMLHAKPNEALGKRKRNSTAASSSGGRNRSLSLTNLSKPHRDVTSNRPRYNSTSTNFSGSPVNVWKYGSIIGMPLWRRHKNTNGSSKPVTNVPNKPSVRPSTAKPSVHHSFSSNARSSDRNEKKVSTSPRSAKQESRIAFAQFYSAQLEDYKIVGNSSRKQQRQSRSKHSSKLRTEEAKELTTTELHTADSNKIKTIEEEKSFAISETPDDTDVLNQSESASKTHVTSNDITSDQIKNVGSLASMQQTDKTVSSRNKALTMPPMSSLISRLDHSKSNLEGMKSQSANILRRNKTLPPMTTTFLTQEQLIIRESVEKVQRWMRGLPKHFDNIHQVLPPVQQDY